MGKHISFSNNNNQFTAELKKKVEEYFSKNGIKTTGSWRLYHKTLTLCGIALAIYLVLIFGSAPVWLNILLCAVLGLTFAAIGFNVMHDGAHGSYSSKKWVNELMSYSLNVLGGSSYLWKVKHNVMHHAYTNIEGHDDDIDIKPFIRTNVHQKRYWFHRYQHIYSFILYLSTYLLWIAVLDFRKYFTGKVSERKFAKMSMSEHIGFWVSKIAYTLLFIVIPIVVVGWAHALIGYFIIAGVCGLVLSIVFQLAHIVEDSEFPMPDPQSNKIEQNWFVHQLATTANFATKSKLVSWFVGGLNFQVEHHLFPKVSHIHYPAINQMVKELCQKYQVKYIEYPTVFRALQAHVSHLRIVGAA